MVNEEEFFTGVLGGLDGGMPSTPWRLAVFSEWHRHEGMPLGDTWNPIATTWLSDNTPLNLTWNVGYGPGNWNSVPVRVYLNPDSGIRATYQTLNLDYYPNVRRCFRDQTGYQEAVNELATYVGSVAYGQQLVNFMNTCTESKGGIDLTPAEVEKLIDDAINSKLRSSQLIDSAQLPELVAQIFGVHNDSYSDQSINEEIRAAYPKGTSTVSPKTKTPSPAASGSTFTLSGGN